MALYRVDHISNLLSGKSRLTEDVALKLESIFRNIPASYWLNYETKYREYLAREEDTAHLENSDLDKVSRRFLFKEVFRGLDWSLLQQANEMLKLLKISDFNYFDAAYSDLAVDFMEDGGDIEPIAIWLNLCEQEIEIQNDNLDNISFNLEKLKDSLHIFKKLAYNPKLDLSISSCRKLCNKLGIYLVLHEAIVNSKVRGALTTYHNHPAIYLSGRYKTHDHVWFAFMHEIGHLLIHYNYKETIISFENSEDSLNSNEKEANEFARDFFINPRDYVTFIRNNDFTSQKIDTFAIEQEVMPGIVVARLQHDGYLPRSAFNYKK